MIFQNDYETNTNIGSKTRRRFEKCIDLILTCMKNFDKRTQISRPNSLICGKTNLETT